MLSDKISVLLIEDNTLALKIGKIILQDLNCKVDTAESGKIAIEKISHETYQIILLDIGLPDIDGLCIIEHIRETENPNKEAVIIVLTAQVDKEYQNQSLKNGASEYFHKPLSLELGKSILEKYS